VAQQAGAALMNANADGELGKFCSG
jgi:hypothetical protein